MSYLAQTRLTNDGGFIMRTEAVLTEQSLGYLSSLALDVAALAAAVLRGDGTLVRVFTTLLAAAPGFAATADPDADDVPDSSLIGDLDLLAATQAAFPVVAGLFFEADGTPKP